MHGHVMCDRTGRAVPANHATYGGRAAYKMGRDHTWALGRPIALSSDRATGHLIYPDYMGEQMHNHHAWYGRSSTMAKPMWNKDRALSYLMCAMPSEKGSSHGKAMPVGWQVAEPVKFFQLMRAYIEERIESVEEGSAGRFEDTALKTLRDASESIGRREGMLPGQFLVLCHVHTMSDKSEIVILIGGYLASAVYSGEGATAVNVVSIPEGVAFAGRFRGNRIQSAALYEVHPTAVSRKVESAWTDAAYLREILVVERQKSRHVFTQELHVQLTVEYADGKPVSGRMVISDLDAAESALEQMYETRETPVRDKRRTAAMVQRMESGGMDGNRSIKQEIVVKQEELGDEEESASELDYSDDEGVALAEPTERAYAATGPAGNPYDGSSDGGSDNGSSDDASEDGSDTDNVAGTLVALDRERMEQSGRERRERYPVVTSVEVRTRNQPINDEKTRNARRMRLLEQMAKRNRAQPSGSRLSDE